MKEQKNKGFGRKEKLDSALLRELEILAFLFNHTEVQLV